MAQIQKSTLVNYSVEQMFDLVNDVAAYPQYIEGCVGAEVLEQSESHMVAPLVLSKAGVKQSFTTRNTLNPYDSIVLELVDGPFTDFKGKWTFRKLSDDACKVIFELDFNVKQAIFKKVINALFDSVANNIVGSLTARASHVYG